jgi:hypothetical protein
MRAARRAVLLGAYGMLAGCFAYRPAPLSPAPGARVRIVLASAVEIATTQSGADSARRSHPGVLEASGTVQAAAADTIALRLGELRTAQGAVPGVAGRVALVPTGQIAKIEEWRFQAGTTALVGFGAATLALTTFLVVVIVAMTRGF